MSKEIELNESQLCRKCGQPHYLQIDDAGSDREVDRTCEKCFIPQPIEGDLREANLDPVEWEGVPEGVQKAVGLLSYLRHEVDYLPDDIYEWIDKVIHAIECDDYARSLPTVKAGKTLQECKDEAVYRSALPWTKWDELEKFLTERVTPRTVNRLIEDIAELYAQSHLPVGETQEGEWREVSKELPKPKQFCRIFSEGVILDVFRFLPNSLTGNGFDCFDSKTIMYTVDQVTHWLPEPQPPITK